MAYYKELTPVSNTGGEVFIHQLESSIKGIWYCRIKRTTSAGYFKKSLKTTDKHEAKKRANRYWVQVREAEENDVVLAPRNNFRACMKEWFKFKKERGDENATSRTAYYQFKNYYEPYFGAYNIGHITERAYINYLNNHRLRKDKCPSMRKQPTLNTLDAEQSNLRSFLSWCHARGKIRNLPTIRRIINNVEWIDKPHLVDWDKPQRRDVVSMEMYEAFRTYLRNVPTLRPRDKRESEYYEMSRRRFHFYLLTIYNFVARAGDEVLMLRFRDFTIHESEEHESAYYMSIKTSFGKKVRRRSTTIKNLTYFSDFNYLKYFKVWTEFLQEKGFPTTPDSFVFPVAKLKHSTHYRKRIERDAKWNGGYKPYDSRAVARMIKWLRPRVKAWLQERGRLTKQLEMEIQHFTPYSVRHIAIRNLIVNSEYNLQRVAERSNTGITMIEQYYYRYGQKPEQRLVSKHPEPSGKNTQRHDDSIVEFLSDVLEVKESRRKKTH